MILYGFISVIFRTVTCKLLKSSKITVISAKSSVSLNMDLHF